MFRRMKDMVKSSIESAKAVREAKRLERDLEDAALAVEITVAERHSALCERLAAAQQGHADLDAMIHERYGRDFIPVLASQLSCDPNRLELLAAQLAAFEAIKANTPRLISEHKKLTVDSVRPDLEMFEREHRAVLKKLGAIG